MALTWVKIKAHSEGVTCPCPHRKTHVQNRTEIDRLSLPYGRSLNLSRGLGSSKVSKVSLR